jgi:hypothetical protein
MLQIHGIDYKSHLLTNTKEACIVNVLPLEDWVQFYLHFRTSFKTSHRLPIAFLDHYALCDFLGFLHKTFENYEPIFTKYGMIII